EARPNPRMVTAASLAVECSGDVAAIQVWYRAGTDSESTPRLPTTQCPLTVDVLGLLPETSYDTRVVVWNAGGDSVVAVGPYLAIASLPTDLPAITVTPMPSEPPGFTVFCVINSADPGRSGVALIVDSVGRIRWYTRADRLITDLQPQGRGRYTLTITP